MYTERFRDERGPDSPFKQYGYFLPENGRFLQDKEQLIRDALDSLPVNGCELTFHPLTNEPVFAAPEGEAFRMYGRFHVMTASDEVAVGYQRPVPSTAVMEDERAKYDDGIDSSISKSVSVDYFEGQYLSIGLATHLLHEPANSGDGWEQYWAPSGFSSDSHRPELDIQVQSGVIDVEDLGDWLFRATINLPDTDSEDTLEWDFDLPGKYFAWRFHYAETSLPLVEVERVKASGDYSKQSLEVPSTRRVRKLWLPQWARANGDSEDFVEALSFGLLARSHPEKAAPMYRFFTAHGPVDIDRFAELAEKDDLPAYGWTASDTKEGHRFWQEKIRRKYRQMLTVIEGSGHLSLDSFVQDFLDPDWLDKRLEKYFSYSWNREYDD